MYNLLVVEDEYQIRIHTSAYIRQQIPGINVYEASNGEDALSKLQKFNIDAMLLDIKMKKMDGLELLRILKHRNMLIPTAIISGYSDFEFAQQAIDLGVLCYLVKPFTPLELLHVVELLREHIDKKRKNDSTIFKLENDIAKSNEQLKNEYFSSWVFGRIENSSFLKQISHSNCSFNHPYYSVAILALNNNNIVLIKKLINQFAENEKNLSLQLFETQDGLAMVFGLEKVEHDDHIVFLNRIIYHHFADSKMGVGLVNQGLSGIVKSYIQAQRALRTECNSDTNKIIIWSQKQNEKSNLLFDSLSIILGIIRLDKAFVMTEFNTVLNPNEQGRKPTLEEIETVCSMVYGCCKLVLSRSSAHYDLFPTTGHFMRTLQKCSFLEEMRLFTEGIVEKCIEHLSEATNSEGRLIEQTKYLIEKCYSSNITVSSLADQLELNANYLGKLFKKSTGESISNYLNRIRIQKAVLLFRKTNLNVSEVSSTIGYRDHSYFSFMFKKIVGQSPSAFRDYISFKKTNTEIENE